MIRVIWYSSCFIKKHEKNQINDFERKNERFSYLASCLFWQGSEIFLCYLSHLNRSFLIFSMYFLGKWGIGYQKTLSVDRSLGIGGLTIQLKNTINGVCQVSYVTHGPIILKIFRHNLSYSDRAVFSFNLFIIFPFFLSAKFLRDGWIDVPKIFRDGRDWKHL